MFHFIDQSMRPDMLIVSGADIDLPVEDSRSVIGRITRR
jgi:hypothetical protein